MKIFNQEIAFEIENKKRAAICCGVILLCLGYTVVNFFSEKPKPHPVPQSNQTQQTAGKGAAASSSDESVSISAPTLDALLKVNPFVGVQEMNAGTAGRRPFYGRWQHAAACNPTHGRQQPIKQSLVLCAAQLPSGNSWPW